MAGGALDCGVELLGGGGVAVVEGEADADSPGVALGDGLAVPLGGGFFVAVGFGSRVALGDLLGSGSGALTGICGTCTVGLPHSSNLLFMGPGSLP